MRLRRAIVSLLIPLSAAWLTAVSRGALAQETAPPTVSLPSEAELVDQIKKLRGDKGDHSRLSDAATKRDNSGALLDAVDALLDRFPQSEFKEQALLTKLETLSRLAQTRSEYVGRLLELTESVAKVNPKGELASENAYFAVQAFVLGARLEEMPENRRLLGTLERYKAFVDDYPDSPRRPVIWASLIRNLLALKQVDRAQYELGVMHAGYPDHAATRRAAGEFFRATAVGKPYPSRFELPDGQVVRTTDYLGKVLIVHFWATWSRASLEGLPKLVALHNEYKDRGLRLIGVNVDNSPLMIEASLAKFNMPWPQVRNAKGFESDEVIDSGVVTLPAFFVLGRDGIVRNTDPGDQLREVIEPLLAEAVQAPMPAP